MSAAPKRPCASCPYRRNVPSGVWAANEYEKLPLYDLPTGDQPPTAFFCHQENERLCAGWCGTHDMDNSLGLRIAMNVGLITTEDYEKALDYVSPVPLFDSGREAAEHGLADIEAPSLEARRIVDKLSRSRSRAKRS